MGQRLLGDKTNEDKKGLPQGSPFFAVRAAGRIHLEVIVPYGPGRGTDSRTARASTARWVRCQRILPCAASNLGSGRLMRTDLIDRLEGGTGGDIIYGMILT